MQGGGFEPPNLLKEGILSPSRLTTSLPLHIGIDKKMVLKICMRKLFKAELSREPEDGHSGEEIPVPIPNTEVKLAASCGLVSDKRRNTDAVFVYFLYSAKFYFLMRKDISRTEAKKIINEYFSNNYLDKKKTRKIKRLAMKYKIRLGKYRKKFCKKCFYDLTKGKVRITKHYKTVACNECGFMNRFKLS